MANLTPSMYMDFEIPSLSVTDLENGDHYTGGSWSTVGTGMSLDVAGKVAIPGTINGVPDVSTKGMASDSTGGTPTSQRRKTLAAPVDTMSFAVALIACSLTVPRTFSEYDIVEWSGVSGPGFYLKHGDNGGSNDLTLFDNVTSGRQVILTLISGNKYWITGRWTHNGSDTTAEVKVYEAGGTWGLLASSTRTIVGSDEQCTAVGLGPLVGGAESNPPKHYYAQFMIDDVTAQFPMVPTPEPTMGYVKRVTSRPRPFAPGLAR